MTSILNQIARQKRKEVEAAKQRLSESTLRSRDLSPTRDFIQALQNHHPAIIAEIKRASPSKGIIRPDFDVAFIAEQYTRNGASCLSVLTDENFFHGHPDYIQLAKAHSNLPVLRKDFIIDAYQIYESRALGADCILLIVALLDDAQLLDFCQLAQTLNMAVLVESHTQEELERAIPLPTSLMGINNRSLHTFKTDLQCSIDLKAYLPPSKLLITESGINTRNDIERMQTHGINHFLIGEALMREHDFGGFLHHLVYG